MDDDGKQVGRNGRKPHEDRSIRRLGVLVGSEGEHEVGIPRVAASIDAVWRLGALDDALGPLAPSMAHRIVAVEFYSARVPPGGLADATFKGAWVAKSWWRQPSCDRFGTRPPLMLVIANDRLRRRVDLTWFRSVSAGIRRLVVGDDFELIVVELADVPLRNGTTGLHMLGRPSDDGGRRVLEAFLADPTVSLEVRARIEVEIMNGTIPSTDIERMTAAERVRAEGELRGRARAIQDARQVVLEQVRAALGDDAVSELSTIDDFDDLCVRAFAMMAARR